MEKYTEEIDGVTVVHTGIIGDFAYKDGITSHEVIEMYDHNGNKFYSNCSSLDQAEKLVECLKIAGKKAVIGPKPPYIEDADRNLIDNNNSSSVGVYIIKELEEEMLSDCENKGKTR